MATDYVVPAYRVNQMRRAARQFRVAAIGAIRAHDGNDQSCIAPYDANGLLPVYLHLRMRAGYRLGAYQFGGRGDAFCVPFVIPEHQDIPDLTDFNFTDMRLHDLPGLVFDFMQYIEGDDSPESYFEASIFNRELHELGAMWHACNWSTHTLLTSARMIPPDHDRRWKKEQPGEWRPCVKIAPKHHTVTFYTHTGLHPERIELHTDVYTQGYTFTTKDDIIAEGNGGYVF